MDAFENTSVSSSLSRQRYKVAMTARARQRRMRRMKEKQENANNNITTTSIIGVNKQQNKTAEESNTAKNTNSNNIPPQAHEFLHTRS